MMMMNGDSCNTQPVISALDTSLHELVDKNTEMQTELLQFHKRRCEVGAATPMECDENDGIPKDSVALSRRSFQHLYDDDGSEAGSTAAESASETSSFAGSNSSCFDFSQRRVRFLMEEDPISLHPRVAATYSSVPEPISQEEREQMWYSAEEFKSFRKYSKKLASMACATQYGKELQHVLTVCNSATSQDVTHCSRIANTAVRGLEVAIAEDMIAQRRQTVRGVLEAQAALGRTGPSSCCRGGGGQDRDQVICQASRHLTRSARLFARILGNGDAAVARAVSRQ